MRLSTDSILDEIALPFIWNNPRQSVSYLGFEPAHHDLHVHRPRLRLLVAFNMSVFVKISTLIATAAAVTCWEMGLFQYLPLIGWLFERNPK